MRWVQITPVDQWLCLDSQVTALDDLEEFAHQLGRMREQPKSAKWALCALHSSLQNFFVASITDRLLL